MNRNHATLATLFQTAILANAGFIADKDPRANGANYSCALFSIPLLRSVTLLCICIYVDINDLRSVVARIRETL